MSGARNDMPADAARIRRVVLICAVFQNITIGFGYGSFGPLLHANELYFNIGRVAASAGMSTLTLAIGLLSPIAGTLFQRGSVRQWMTAGALLGGAGYALLAVAPNYVVGLIAYGMIGASMGTGLVGPTTVVVRWVKLARGRALSIVNLPIVLLFTPFLIGILLPHIGRSHVLLGLSALSLLLLPLLWFLEDRPPAAAASASDAPGAATTPDVNLWRLPSFWLSSFSIGLVAGTGSTLVVHLVPLGMEHGMSIAQASLVLSLYTGLGLLGNPLVGWLADRFGPLVTLIITDLVSAVLLGLLAIASPIFIYGAACGLGLFLVPLVTLHGAAMAALFGPELAGKALGCGYAVKLAPMFGMVPLAAMIREDTGGYAPAFLLCAVVLLIAALLIAFVARQQASAKRAARNNASLLYRPAS